MSEDCLLQHNLVTFTTIPHDAILLSLSYQQQQIIPSSTYPWLLYIAFETLQHYKNDAITVVKNLMDAQ